MVGAILCARPKFGRNPHSLNNCCSNGQEKASNTGWVSLPDPSGGLQNNCVNLQKFRYGYSLPHKPELIFNWYVGANTGVSERRLQFSPLVLKGQQSFR